MGVRARSETKASEKPKAKAKAKASEKPRRCQAGRDEKCREAGRMQAYRAMESEIKEHMATKDGVVDELTEKLKAAEDAIAALQAEQQHGAKH